MINEITNRTELLIEIYELIESTKQNFNDSTEIEALRKEFNMKQVTLKKQVTESFQTLISELKRKEERMLTLLEANFSQFDKLF